MSTDKIQLAKDFAIAAHWDQKYGVKPYIVHLEDVASVLSEFGHTDDVMQCAAFLHDTIEDTATNYNDIKSNFGEEVAEIVYAVTDELGRNRKERHQRTYPKIFANEKAIIVKLADRISNTRASVADTSDKSKLDMYRKEYKLFKTILFDGNNAKMWEELDRLSKE